ncbi:MAG: hypothetical protein K0R08_1958 [Solimicrobium sp.]|jgi:hypothetical protein|nr:hypothetical protein [Solimicrobium sp.]
MHYQKKAYKDSETKRVIYLSQKSIYQDLLLQKPEHIYPEHMTSLESEYQKTAAIKNVSFNMILDSLNNNQELGPEGQRIFCELGGAYFCALNCFINNTPLKVHVTISDEDSRRVTEILTATSSTLYSYDLSTRYFLTTYLEEKVADVVMRTAGERNGKPAFLVYGFEHKFDTSFSGSDAPAIYRRL